MQAKKRDSIEKADLPTLSQIMHKEIDSLYKLSKASINALFINTTLGINLRTSNSSASYLRDFITTTNQFMKVRHLLLLSQLESGIGSFLINLKSFGSSKEKTTDTNIKQQFDMLWTPQDQIVSLTARTDAYQSFTRQFDEVIVTPSQRVYSMSTNISSIPGEDRKIIGLFFVDDSEFLDCVEDTWEL